MCPDSKRLYDKVYACWLGKNIGGTLGAPVEGKKELLDLTWYPVLPEGAALPNDDLDLQLLNLHAAEQYGVRLTAADIAAEWCEHVYFPWDEYGAALAAMRYGFAPPFCGGFDNHFTDCMGSPIRSEIWACACAGQPDAAVFFAWQDAVVDHAGGEGVWGEVFNAAIEAAAFICDDKRRLVSDALARLPRECRVYRAAAFALELYDAGVSYREAREAILREHGHHNFTDAPQNIAFEIVGLLWSDSFEDALLKTVNLGYDTDCTVATVGSLLGIMYGSSYIPEKWSAPVGDAVCVSPQIRGFTAPADLGELTRRALRLRERVLLEDPGVYKISNDDFLDMSSQRFTLPQGCRPDEGIVLRLTYAAQPVVTPDMPCDITVTLTNNTGWQWRTLPRADCPEGLCATLPGEICVPAGGTAVFTVRITASSAARRINRLNLTLRRLNDGMFWTEYSVPFTLLSPNIWTLNGKRAAVPGMTVRFDEKSEDGVYIAEGRLSTPLTRETQLMCATQCPVTVELDGVRVIDSPESQSFLPAFHRAPKCQRTSLTLEAGIHSVRITLKSDEPPMFVFAATAPKKVGEPGNYYAYIDNAMI